MPGQLNNKIALITGAGSGIGRATALAFAREGARLFLTDISPAGGEETVAMVRAAGGEARFMKVDVTQAPEVAAMVQGAVVAYGRLDVAFNNAGISGTMFVPVADYGEDAWDRVIDINLKGVFLCLKYEMPAMLKNGGGAIVNTASVAGLVGSRVGVAYIASKHGVVGLTKATALEYVTQGIRVNAVCPSWITTPLTDPFMAQDPGLEGRMVTRQPGGRLCTVEEVAEAVVWLASDAASFITGHAMAVDGGLVVQ
ncbi:MAG: glucose 1-dehydrogenase [Dehalococcoidia bacterium]|nr:glucose 1-dehydrogenase [Dehalococcoidia bacterium]